MTLEEKFEVIKENLGHNANIYFDEVARLFPNLKKASLYWALSKLVENGYLKRVRNGIYAINEYKGKKAVFLSETAEKVQSLLDESGFVYYISGIDVIAKFLHHIPMQYPIIVFVEKAAFEKVGELLNTDDIISVKADKIMEEYERNWISGGKDIVVLNQTDSFAYQEQGIAIIEKAFLDLYYEVTRNKYPLALQELVRTYQNMVRTGALDKKKLTKISYVRNMQYDIRFITESKFITEEAFSFVDLLRREG